MATLLTNTVAKVLQKTGITTTAVQITATSTKCNGLVLVADRNNADDLLWGDSAAQTFPLLPGSGIPINIDDVNKIYVKAVSGTLIAHVYYDAAITL